MNEVRMKVLWEIWEVEMYKGMKWQKERRFYKNVKSKTDDDLCDVKGLRRNAKFIGFTPKTPNSK